jgi:hypothetical protein
MKGNFHIYSFVERVKPYRLVYDSIGTVNDIQEKKSSKVISQFLTLFRCIFGVVGVRPILVSQ